MRNVQVYVDQIDSCCIADQGCTAAANYETRGRLCECFSCGNAVCRNCSSKRKYYNYGKVRLCNDCQEQYDNGDHYVLRRIYHRMGYHDYRMPPQVRWNIYAVGQDRRNHMQTLVIPLGHVMARNDRDAFGRAKSKGFCSHRRTSVVVREASKDEIAALIARAG